MSGTGSGAAPPTGGMVLIELGEGSGVVEGMAQPDPGGP